MGNKTLFKAKTLVTNIIKINKNNFMSISDMLTRIRNANRAMNQFVFVPYNKIALTIMQILKSEGFILDFKVYRQNNTEGLLASLRYRKSTRKPVITEILQVSKPGAKIYVRANKIPTVLNNMGIAILSTSQGIMTDIEAKKLGIGGELLFYIW